MIRPRWFAVGKWVASQSLSQNGVENVASAITPLVQRLTPQIKVILYESEASLIPAETVPEDQL